MTLLKAYQQSLKQFTSHQSNLVVRELRKEASDKLKEVVNQLDCCSGRRQGTPRFERVKCFP